MKGILRVTGICLIAILIMTPVVIMTVLAVIGKAPEIQYEMLFVAWFLAVLSGMIINIIFRRF